MAEQKRLRKTKLGWEVYLKGYAPAVRARKGLMLGIRNPLDGPVFEKLEDATTWSMSVMASHFERGLGISDARIEAFEGWCCTFPPLNSGVRTRE